MHGLGSPPRRSCVAALAVVLASPWLIACPGPSAQVPPPGDSGTAPSDGDAGGDVLDSDGDGLCDDTEHSRRTDPFDPDTDADGFNDWVEVVYSYDPLLPASPPRDMVVSLHETPEARAQVPVSVVVRGRGEDYAGAFEALRALDPLDTTAAAFFDSAVALFANPPDNAAIVEEEEERFRVVVGTTELNFEVRLAFGDDIPRSCLRAYPFRYTIKRSDGRIVGSQRRLLVIVPDGGTIARSEWCAPSPPCM